MANLAWGRAVLLKLKLEPVVILAQRLPLLLLSIGQHAELTLKRGNARQQARCCVCCVMFKRRRLGVVD